MAEPSEGPQPFDVETIRDLVRLMSRHDLSEIDLQKGDQRIRLRRGSRPTSPAPAPAPAPPAPEFPARPAPAPAHGEKPAGKLVEIKSQLIGTFYAQKEPGAPPYVTAGSRVNPDTIVCQIEAMKVFTEVPAGCSGVVAEVVARDKDFVEFNTVLFRVDPTGA